MKKQHVLLVMCLVFTQIHTIQKRSLRNLERIYDQESATIQTQLSRANLTEVERTNLLNKLKNYFLVNEKPEPVLKNTRTEVLYGSIIKSYQKLLGYNKLLAKKFIRETIGMLVLYR